MCSYTDHAEMPSNKKVALQIRAQINKAPRAEYQDGTCSRCHETVPKNNFCGTCGATFIKVEDID